ncbi:hypothetical protein EG832_22805, partial [bacterium]|nr:hypothetical protein [bacterium]
MNQRWSEQEVWAWQEKNPWILGFNYLPANCINFVEIWQEDGFEEVFQVIDRELAIAQETGFNSLRTILPFFVWKHQRAGFLNRLDRVLALAERRGITMLPVLFDDCCVPRTVWSPPKFGKQPDPVPGHHGGTVITPFDDKKEVGYNFVDEPEVLPDIEGFVKDLLRVHGKDPRVIAWDIWNEPGNGNRKSLSLPIMEKAFTWAREQDPIQPLTACCWGGEFFVGHKPMLEIELRALELSDVISFHFFGNYDRTLIMIEDMKQYHRPLLITEWLHRPLGNLIETLLPLFKKEKIG